MLLHNGQLGGGGGGVNSQHVTVNNQYVTNNGQWVPTMTSCTKRCEGQWPISYHNILNILVYNPLYST